MVKNLSSLLGERSIIIVIDGKEVVYQSEIVRERKSVIDPVTEKVRTEWHYDIKLKNDEEIPPYGNKIPLYKSRVKFRESGLTYVLPKTTHRNGDGVHAHWRPLKRKK